MGLRGMPQVGPRRAGDGKVGSLAEGSQYKMITIIPCVTKKIVGGGSQKGGGLCRRHTG